MKELYDYIRTGRAESALTRKIEEAVGRARKNEEWRTEYMKELLHDDVREEGRAEGRAEERSTRCMSQECGSGLQRKGT